MENTDSRHTVLIVDDAPENLQVLSHILYEQGINISVAESGREAIELVAHKPPDLILLDIVMPEMDGYEVCARLHQEPATKNISIIFLTAKDQMRDIVKGFECGAVDYVTKPFNPPELLARVLTHLELKRSRDLLTAQNQERRILLENTLEALTHPFYVIDASDYTVKLANSTARLNGITDAITCYALTHRQETPCEGTEHPCPLREVKCSRKAVTVEHIHFDHAGRRRYVEIHGYPMFDTAGNVHQMLEYALDITDRKLAEQALQRSEQQYRRLAESVADGIGILQNGKLVFVNEALTSMLGYSAEQLLGSTLLDLVHEDHKANIQQAYEQLEAGKHEPQWHLLQCIVRGDGREIWIEGRHSLIEWEGNSAILVSIRDISQHKLREIEIVQEREHLRRENLQLKSTIKERYRFGDIVGKSPAMQDVYKFILDASETEANVIICGESGTGKDLIAQTIHQLSQRKDKPFVPVNCGAIQESLSESEFFGHRKGSFTGAYRHKEGFFDMACGGSLFLDELETLSPVMQAKLLRAVEGGGYMPVGGDTLKKTNVRIIAATNRDLSQQVEQGLMREDFFYRMSVIVILVPPLRERREDIPLLIDHFLRIYSDDEASRPGLSGKMLRALYDYDWLGNVRELQNTIQRFLATKRLDFIGTRADFIGTSSDSIGMRKFEFGESGEAASLESELHTLLLPEAVETFEKKIILRILQQHRWNQSKTAQTLGITRRSLIRRMKKYGLKSHSV